MKKVILYIFIVLTILVLSTIITFFILAKVHHRTVHQEMVQILNEEFEEKITFKDFSFSYLRYFPRIHLEIKELNVHSENKQILTAGDIDIFLNLKGFWTKKIILENINITDVNFYISVDSLGNKTHLFGEKKKKPERTKKHPLKIDSGNIQITNARIHSRNDVKKNRLMVVINQAQLELSNNNDFLVLEIGALGNLDTLVANEALLFSNQSFPKNRLLSLLWRNHGLWCAHEAQQ